MNIKTALDDNPYSVWDNISKNWGTSSRESSVSKVSRGIKKPPTVPRPFRLSTSNWRKKEENITPNGSEDREVKDKQKFKAKRVPYSHRVPFMVLHSAKNLTQPETFNLRTNERSISRNRSDSNKQIQKEDTPEFKSSAVRKSDQLISKIDDENVDSFNLVDFSIDDIIKAEEKNEAEQIFSYNQW